MSDKMHLLGFMIQSPMNHTALMWSDERDERLRGLTDFSYWKDIAQTLERGLFDGVFFADGPGIYDRYKESYDTAIEYGMTTPPFDPMPVVATMLEATSRLGIGVTLSTNAVHPYTCVRIISSLDYISKGRVGWNVVTGHQRAEHRALGTMELPAHDDRYERAEEYMDIVYALWDSWEDDAIVADRQSGRFADPSKVKLVDYRGKYFSCYAPGPIPPSPQGRPVVFQAGSSARGMAFAADHAEVVFAIQPTLESMTRFTERVRAAEQSVGRQRPSKVVFGAQCIVADTVEHALQEQRDMNERVPVEAGLARMSGSLGVDFSQYDPDLPLQELETDASRGSFASTIAMLGTERPTLRQAATRWAVSAGMPQIVGTPESVADELERLWRNSGADGFNITPTYTPGSFEIFVDQVVPLLQKRGVFRTEYEGSTLRANLLGG